MSKTRKCRYTDEQAAMHREAVRIRKMTDEQIVSEIERIRDNAEQQAVEKLDAMIRCEVTDEFCKKYGIDLDPNESQSETLRKIYVALVYTIETLDECTKAARTEKIFRTPEAKELFMKKLTSTPGIGKATADKIRKFIEEHC